MNAGVPPTQVAEWAGHSVNVLLRVYAKCVYGQDEVARQRIEAALAVTTTSEAETEAEGEARAPGTLKVAKPTGALPANSRRRPV